MWVHHNHEEYATQTRVLPSSYRDKGTTRILVIDDEERVRALLRLAFEMAGYSVIEASDGAIGMQLYRTAPTDLVITDIHMPKRGGLEIIQELRTTFPMTRIFAISGDVGTEHDPLLLARQLGAMRTFRKPFDLREVLLAVHEVLHDTNATTSSSRSVPL